MNCPNCRTPAPADAPPGQPLACGGCGTEFTPPLLIGGRYEERGPLGEGTNGRVVRAYDRHLRREVAIKLLKPGAVSSPEAVRRFEREADVMAAVSHPHVLPIYDKGEHAGGRFLVCKLVGGKSMDKLIPPGGWDDPREAVGHAVTLARTLHDVYSTHQVLHRDVKPSNLILEGEHLFLADLGLVGYRDANAEAGGLATVAFSAVGTPAYMPPEQVLFERHKVGPWSDVYGVGAVLYHLLTGSVPIPRMKGLHDILQVKPSPPSRLRLALDPALDPVVLKSLEKRPEDRYQTTDEFARALVRWRDGGTATQPLPLPPPDPVPPRPLLTDPDDDDDAPPKRNRLFLWLAVGLAALLLIGVVIALGVVLNSGGR